MKYLLPSLILGLLLAMPVSALATDFNPDYLLSDSELTDADALTHDQIQYFLDRGFLGDYETEDFDDIERTATSIIWNAAQDHGISPKFLLVLLQKEQSLVEDDDPTQNQLDWATGYAVCDDCAKDDPAIQRWKGFGKQVNSAALQFIEGYMEDIDERGTTQGKYGPDVDVVIDNTIVTPVNAATAALYAYTPHLHGNENFVKIWSRWFQPQHPTGSLLQVAGEPGIYVIEYGYKRPIHSWSAFLSRFNPDLIVQVTQNVLDLYPDGRAIDFANYSLLEDETGQRYLLVDDALRPFESNAVFSSIGFIEDELLEIDSDDVALFDEGTTITLDTLNPTGALLQIHSGVTFYVENGYRSFLLDDAVREARFPGQPVTQVDPSALGAYLEASPLGMPDGYLVKTPNDPKVYVISENEARAILDEQTFLSFGWEWNDIIVISELTMKQHAFGEDLETGLSAASE
jgi:hypothetical protein